MKRRVSLSLRVRVVSVAAYFVLAFRNGDFFDMISNLIPLDYDLISFG